jgi:hypothetical protein
MVTRKSNRRPAPPPWRSETGGSAPSLLLVAPREI